MAKILGVGFQTVLRWENGKNMMTAHHLKKLSDIGINPFYLVGEESALMLSEGRTIDKVQDVAHVICDNR
jgi:transcriptional regulator with XRE-family HTH domain